MQKIKSIFRAYYLDSILSYFLLSVLTFFTLYYLGWIDQFPGNKSLAKFDVGFYRSIKNDGYIYLKGNKCNAGFFPLFAYLWQITPFDKLGIAVVNGLIYLSSLAFLSKLLKPDRIVLGFFMSSPFLFFMFVPLTEALFFCCCTIIIYGLVRNNRLLLFTGILLASMTRASFLFFIPAFVGMSLMQEPIRAIFRWQLWKTIFINYLLPCFLGIFFVLTIQYLQTDKWGAYFDIQYNVWERQFNWPTLPVYRNSPDWVFRWSILSFWIGMIAALIGLKYLWEWINGKDLRKRLSAIELFSIIFLVMSLISVLFFNPKWAWFGQFGKSVTYLGGINRYIHTNTFFFILLLFFYRQENFSFRQLIGLFFTTQFLWFFIEPTYWDHIAKLWRVSIVTLLLLPYWVYHKYRWSVLGYGIILTGFVFQVLMLGYFMNSTFVD